MCPTLCDPIDYSLPVSSVHGIFQAILLEWIAISFSRGSSQPRDRTRISYVSCIAGRFCTTEPTGMSLSSILHSPNIDRETQFTQRRNCPRHQQSRVSNFNCLAPGSVPLTPAHTWGPSLPWLPPCQPVHPSRHCIQGSTVTPQRTQCTRHTPAQPVIKSYSSHFPIWMPCSRSGEK